MKNVILFLFFLIFAGCTIDNNPGPSGPPGPPGAPGNANVISTEAITLNTWTYSNQYNWYSANVSMPEITNDVLNSGLVMVYQRISSNPNPVWIPLPDTYGNITTNYDFYRNGLTVYSFNVDNTTPIAPTGMVIRVVVIPSSFREAHPEANWHNFQETKEILNLAE